MSFKFSFKSTEMFRLSQFERNPNDWRCDAKRAKLVYLTTSVSTEEAYIVRNCEEKQQIWQFITY